MDNFSLASSTTHYCSTFSSKPYSVSTRTATTIPFYPITTCSHDTENPTTSSSLRRPTNNKPFKPIANSPVNPHRPKPKTRNTNPLQTLLNPTPKRNPIDNSSQTLTEKLWLTSKLSPPPEPAPQPPPPPPDLDEVENDSYLGSSGDTISKKIEYREKGKIFVGNLPLWIKKNKLTEFFRQFGPIKNVILIKGYNDTERNMGFGFVIYGGATAEKAAMNAVEFDGMEFHGRVITVKLDDGRRMKEKSVERARWIQGDDTADYKSAWQEERDSSRKELKRVLETQPENWQAVVGAFQRIKKVIALVLSIGGKMGGFGNESNMPGLVS